MKKMIALVLALVLALSLVACGGNSETPNNPDVPNTGAPEQSEPVVKDVDLDVFYNELYAELYPLDADGYPTGPHADDMLNPPVPEDPSWAMTEEEIHAMVEMTYPGLLNVEAKQMHLFVPGMSFSAYEVVLIEVVNEADIETVKTILQARIDTQAAGGAWYPEAVEGWTNNARIVTNGNYIMMAVGQDCDTFVDRFNAQF